MAGKGQITVGMSARERVEWSSRMVVRILYPRARALGWLPPGDLRSVEAFDYGQDHVAKGLDVIAGIDLLLISSRGLYGLETRVENIRNKRGFTVRTKLVTGGDTEFQKRMRARKERQLQASHVLHGYVLGTRDHEVYDGMVMAPADPYWNYVETNARALFLEAQKNHEEGNEFIPVRCGNMRESLGKLLLEDPPISPEKLELMRRRKEEAELKLRTPPSLPFDPRKPKDMANVASLWVDEWKGHRRLLGAYSRCAQCVERGTWSWFGETPLCEYCSRGLVPPPLPRNRWEEMVIDTEEAEGAE